MDWIRIYESRVSFPMQCVRHFLGGENVKAYMIVCSNNGYGLATCAEHREVTGNVVAAMQADDDEQTKALFAVHGAPIETPEPGQ
ncbi:hypothetical protein [Streptomyces sp. NPDC086782]|uniref:hypothetical protein n=1 Tax=Streptomyces sp. NPDC086782 TaxID=3365757 RepID=UPI0038137B7E